MGHRERLNQVNGAGYRRAIGGPSTALGWCIQLDPLSNALTHPYRAEVIPLRRSRGQKPVLSHLIEAKPRGSHRFVTKVTNQISIQYSRMQDFLIKRLRLGPTGRPGPII